MTGQINFHKQNEDPLRNKCEQVSAQQEVVAGSMLCVGVYTWRRESRWNARPGAEFGRLVEGKACRPGPR